MKAYTDIVQSKKLAEILPLESADMYYHNRINISDNFPLPIEWKHGNPLLSQEIPCWSLAALLSVIPKCIGDYNIFRIDINDIDTSIWYDKIGYGVCNELPDITMKEPVDACVEMIGKLHEQNLI